MKFGIIVCPNCKKAKGVSLSCKTTRCPRCGKILTLKKQKIVFETNSEEELRNVIGLVNAEIEGKLKDFQKLIKKY